MKKERILILIQLFIILILLLNQIKIIPVASAQTKANKNYTMSVNSILANEIDAGQLNTNNIKILGYDALLLNQNLINLLIKKGLITKEEGQKVIDQALTSKENKND